MQNVGSRRLTPKLQTYTLANTQNSIIINKGKDLKISKTGLIGMADRCVLVQVKKIYIDRLDSGKIWY